MIRGFEIWGKPVQVGGPALIVAEAGSNHNRDLDLAHQLIVAAAKARADAVKFQNFEAKHLYPKGAGKSDYLGSETPIYEIIEAMEMPLQWLSELRDHSHELGLAFLSSPFHEQVVEELASYVDAFKVASYELTHEPLLKCVARQGLPVILSTGASTLEEARRALHVLREAGCQDVVLLQCTASYPTPPEHANVRALVTLREELGVLTGLSDHTRDPSVAPMAAAALGAVLIEKHFTLDNDLPGPDHAFAVEPAELAQLVEDVRRIETVLGSSRKSVSRVEEELRGFARRALFTTRAIAAGEEFTMENTAALRTGKLRGRLEPRLHAQVLTRRALHDLPAESAIGPDDLSPALAAVDAGHALELLPATLEDSHRVFVWANDELTRSMSFQPDPITCEEHERWFGASLESEQRELWIAREGGVAVGLLRLDFVSVSRDAAEISINLAPDCRGRGLGVRILREASLGAFERGVHELIARIRIENRASRRAFEAAGYSLQRELQVAGAAALRYLLRND